MQYPAILVCRGIVTEKFCRYHLAADKMYYTGYFFSKSGYGTHIFPYIPRSTIMSSEWHWKTFFMPRLKNGNFQFYGTENFSFHELLPCRQVRKTSLLTVAAFAVCIFA